jgi:shikimate dehydrogenase
MRQFGLIGKTLTHSFSKKYFDTFFLENNLKANYNLFECENENAIDVLLQNKLLNGLNVTLPYKTIIIDKLNNLTEDAKQIGAVNCIKYSNNNWIGHNTDWLGFTQVVKDKVKNYSTIKAMILGTGGASLAVQYALKKMNIPFVIVSRTPRPGTITYFDIDATIVKNYSFIINTTPLGMYPYMEASPFLPYDKLGSNNVLFDLIYNPTETLFLQNGKASGAYCINGYDMLINQAKAAWQWWQI